MFLELFSSPDAGLAGLFLAALLAATLLPGGSEVVLGYLVVQGQHDPWLLLVVATAGNTVGSLSSWLIGRWVSARWQPDWRQQAKYQRAEKWLRRYGLPALLMSWMPLVGDPLCLIAGWLRLPLLPSLLMIALGKGARYAVVIAALTELM